MQTAHDFKRKPRTADVQVQDTVEFSSLMLSDEVLAGLTQSGFQCPSPIQLKAIPLGRCGLDLIVQAKSGTGKTCVFAVIALESVLLEYPGVQVLVLAPTREIAVQIWEVLKSIGGCMKKLCCHTFIGGMPKSEDQQKLRKCHIAIGTPGRVKQLIEEKLLLTDSIRLFVLDEADKLMEDSFQDQVNWVYSSLPENKQMLALSATYPEVLAQHLTIYMRNPTFVRLSITDPALLGIRQYQKVVPFRPLTHQQFEEKCKHLVQLLSSVNFDQCLVFSNYQLRAEGLSAMLNKKGWPARYISGSLDQTDRLQAMAALKQFHCRVLISTDVTSRGIDAENVNLVVNLDVPFDHETYLHRVGRAGRFGSYGAAVSFVAQGKEQRQLQEVEKECNTCIKPLPDPVPSDLTRKSGYVNVDSMVTTEVLVTRTTDDTKDTEASIRKTQKDTRKSNKGKEARILKENQQQRGKKNKEMSAKFNYFSETENDKCLPEKMTVTEKLHDKSCPVGKIKLNGEVAEGVKDGVMAKMTTSSEISVNQIHKSKNAVVTDKLKGHLEPRDKELSGPKPTGSVGALHKVEKVNTERMSLLQKNKSKSERTNLSRMNPALTVDKCAPFTKVWCKRVPKYKTFQHAFSDCQKYPSDNSECGKSALSPGVSTLQSQWSPSAKLLNQIRTVISTQPLPQSLGKSDEVVAGESGSSSGSSSTSTCSDSECSYSLGSVEDGDVIKEVDEEEYDEEEEDVSEARREEQVRPRAAEVNHPEEDAQTLFNGSAEANEHYLSEREKVSLQRIQRYAAYSAKENQSSSSISAKYLQKDDFYSHTESVKESQITARDSITASDHEKESHDSSLISSLSSPSDHSDTLSDSSQSNVVHEIHAPFVHGYNHSVDDDGDVENQTYDHGEYEITGAACHKTVPEYNSSYNEYYDDSGAQQYSGTTHQQGKRQSGYYGNSSYSNNYFDNGYYRNDEQENMHYGEHYNTGYHGNATFYRNENYAVEDQFTPWQWGSQNQRQGFPNTSQQPPEQSLDAFRNPASWYNYWSQVYHAGFMGGMNHVTSYMQGYYDRCIQEHFTPTTWWSAHSSAQANYIKYMSKAFRKLQLRRTVDHKDKTK